MKDYLLSFLMLILVGLCCSPLTYGEEIACETLTLERGGHTLTLYLNKGFLTDIQGTPWGELIWAPSGAGSHRLFTHTYRRVRYSLSVGQASAALTARSNGLKSRRRLIAAPQMLLEIFGSNDNVNGTIKPFRGFYLLNGTASIDVLGIQRGKRSLKWNLLSAGSETFECPAGLPDPVL